MQQSPSAWPSCTCSLILCKHHRINYSIIVLLGNPAWLPDPKLLREYVLRHLQRSLPATQSGELRSRSLSNGCLRRLDMRQLLVLTPNPCCGRMLRCTCRTVPSIRKVALPAMELRRESGADKHARCKVGASTPLRQDLKRYLCASRPSHHQIPPRSSSIGTVQHLWAGSGRRPVVARHSDSPSTCFSQYHQATHSRNKTEGVATLATTGVTSS